VEAFLAETATTPKMEVILLDLNLPGVHGVTGIPMLFQRFPDARILVLTVYDHKPVVLEALAAGASGAGAIGAGAGASAVSCLLPSWCCRPSPPKVVRPEVAPNKKPRARWSAAAQMASPTR
jgi:CheY-like chemotaxis protein